MIKHIVNFKFKEQAEGTSKSVNIAKAKEMILDLKNKLDFIVSIEVGINYYYDTPRAADLSIIAVFNTKEDLEAYRIHPEHVIVADFMAKVVDAGFLVDYEC